jgi:3-oxoacyl-ACP reductase-like protein
MSIFGSIVSAIFGSKHASQSQPTTTTATTTSAGASPTTPSVGSPAAKTAAPAGASAPAAQPISRPELEALIAKTVAAQGEKLDWRQSIVDLMKALKLDSSLGARKQLAQELGYSGALDGSAEMNIWLHRQVMTKLAESGGKVPDSLRS